MTKKQLTTEQKKLDTDIWIITIITFGVFILYASTASNLMGFVRNSNISVFPRLLVNAGFQFGLAGMGITAICIFRKESFVQFGLRKKNILKSILGTIICFLPSICYIFASGQFEGYQPFGRIIIMQDIWKSSFPYNILGFTLTAIVWGFFEGFNYAVICDKLNQRYPPKNQWLDTGAITCAIICILFHPFSTSFWGLVEIVTTLIAIYGMLIVKKQTGNAWGCIFAFCFIWNAL